MRMPSAYPLIATVVGRNLGVLLPLQRIAAGVETRDNKKSIASTAKNSPYGNRRKRMWFAAHPFGQGVNRFSEMPPESGGSRSYQS
jgi:hypothetical protein